MAVGALCERCRTRSVVFAREDPPGMRLYRCGGCGEIKRACPRCEQRGWLRH